MFILFGYGYIVYDFWGKVKCIKNGASEETLTLVSEAREFWLGEFFWNKNGASEETLTLDLFLGKEAL